MEFLGAWKTLTGLTIYLFTIVFWFVGKTTYLFNILVSVAVFVVVGGAVFKVLIYLDSPPSITCCVNDGIEETGFF